MAGLNLSMGGNAGTIAPISLAPSVTSAPAPAPASGNAALGFATGLPASTFNTAFPQGNSSPSLPLPQTSTGTPAVFGSQNPTGTTGSLSDYLSSPTQLSNGGTASASGGNVTSPTSFNVDTSGATTGHLASSPTISDINGQQNQLAQYIQQMAALRGNSPYNLAQQQAGLAVQADQARNVMIGNQINNRDALPGATMGDLQTVISQNQQQNAAQQAADALRYQGAQNAYANQVNPLSTLISAYSPQSVAPGSSLVSPVTGQETYSGLGGLVNVNAINSYSKNQDYYQGANIPAYDPKLSPQQNQQIAQNAVSNSPQYRAQYLSTYTTPGGGTGIWDKTNSAGITTQNSDGSISLVSGLAASLGKANSDALSTQVSSYNTTQTAFNTVDSVFSNVTNLMNQYGLNQSGVPFVNQIQDKINAGVMAPGAMAAFKAGIQELRTNLSTVISRGGSVAGSTQEAANLIPDNLSPGQMGQLGTAIHTYGKTAISQIGNQINSITSNFAGAPQQPVSTGGSIGSSWANLLTGK